MISALFLIAISATEDLKVSTETIIFGNFCFISLVYFFIISISFFSSTGDEPGFDEHAPISMISTPSSIIFLHCLIIELSLIYLPPS